MSNQKFCNCIHDCPCYPNCDQMMSEGQMSEGFRSGSQRNSGNRMGQDMSQTMPAPDVWMRQDIPQPDVPIGRGMILQDTQMFQMGNTQTVAQPANGGITPEEESERDWKKLKEMYPDMAKIILVEVENTCDAMEYEGSMMFDSIPDKIRVRNLTEGIYEKVKDRYPVEETTDQDDMFVMNQEGRRRYPPNQNWLNDFIQVLLFQEMFHRRCRHRNCRRW